MPVGHPSGKTGRSPSQCFASRRSRLQSISLTTGLLCLIPAGTIVLAALQSPGAETIRTGVSQSALAERGRSLYTSLCARCHGTDGDSTHYPGIVPLAGIGLRLPPGRIARLSAPFVGRTFEGEEAAALVAYLDTLGGTKGFVEPGYLFSVYLLDHKFQDREGYRILDTRPATAFREGHVPNAVHWPLEDPGEATEEEIRQAMLRSGVSPASFVVVYDEAGGLGAASVWWGLQRAGHRRAAVLDGGLRAWRDAGHRLSTQELRIEVSSALPESSSPNPRHPATGEILPLHLGQPPDGGIAFDWRRTVDNDGLRPAEAIEEYFARSGLRFPATYRIEGNRNELGFLAWLLSLTGREATWDSGLLTVTGSRDRKARWNP